MQCFSPYYVKNQYTNTRGQNKVTPVPCGKCVTCKKRRARHWTFRLHQEAKQSKSVSFLTLTYKDEHLPKSKNGFATLDKKDFQLFMKKLRIECPKSNKQHRIKYYAVGEYGAEHHTTRPHYHAVMFNVPHRLIQSPLKITEIWGKGRVDLEYPKNESKTTNYVTGYITKSTFERRDHIDTSTGLITEDDRVAEFSLMSKGMGLSFLTDKMVKYFKDRKIFVIQGSGGELISMPRYYKQKIFTPTELSAMYQEYINLQDENIEQEINDIGREYFRRQNEQIKALLRKTKKENNLKRLKL